MVYRTPDHFDEDNLTARPKNWEMPKEYNNRGRPEEDHLIREAGWCPKCKEKLEECECVSVPDMFKEKRDNSNR